MLIYIFVLVSFLFSLLCIAGFFFPDFYGKYICACFGWLSGSFIGMAVIIKILDGAK